MRLARLAIPVPDPAALDGLFAAWPDGVAEGSGFSVYRAPERLPAGDALAALGASVEPVPDGWATAYHAHVPRVLAGGLAVRPPWVPGEPGDLVIDPGTAFGAGTHATTQLCLELLQTLPAEGALADLGTGTGVLAVAAARLGWGPVTAVDVSDLELAAANARANGAEVQLRRVDLARAAAPTAPTAVANLTLPLLRGLRWERPPERLLVSGVLAGQVDALPWRDVLERRERDGWAAVVVCP